MIRAHKTPKNTYKDENVEIICCIVHDYAGPRPDSKELLS